MSMRRRSPYVEQSVFLPGRRTATKQQKVKKLKLFFLVFKIEFFENWKDVALPPDERRSSDTKYSNSVPDKQMGLGPLLRVLPVDYASFRLNPLGLLSV